MHHEFWHQRWQQNQIGFHNADINPHLQRYWHHLDLPAGKRVLVPLCGKSKDLLWLMAQGHSVVGVELSPLAVETFFSENGLHPTTRHQEGFSISEVDGLQVYCGDFFALHADLIGHVDAVYDRASLIALPPEMRLDYANQMASLLEPGASTLLIAFDYPQHEMPGPPFSVHVSEIELLYHAWCEIEQLATEEVLSRETHFLQHGLSSLSEHIYRLCVR